MIAMQNIIDNDKSLLTVLFDKAVLEHIKCKCDDYVILLQSNFKPSYFLLSKSDSGYRIRRNPNKKKTYQINIRHRFKFIPEFDFINCTYYLNRNGSIRIVLKANEEIIYKSKKNEKIRYI